MAARVLAIFCLVTMAAADAVVSVTPQPFSARSKFPYSKPESSNSYQFEYSVQDSHSGDMKQQQESRDGDAVRGYYSFIQPDGIRRIVEYTADNVRGFNAVVRYEGRPVEPSARATKSASASPPAFRAAPKFVNTPAPFTYTTRPVSKFNYVQPTQDQILYTPAPSLNTKVAYTPSPLSEAEMMYSSTPLPENMKEVPSSTPVAHVEYSPAPASEANMEYTQAPETKLEYVSTPAPETKMEYDAVSAPEDKMKYTSIPANSAPQAHIPEERRSDYSPDLDTRVVYIRPVSRTGYSPSAERKIPYMSAPVPPVPYTLDPSDYSHVPMHRFIFTAVPIQNIIPGSAPYLDTDSEGYFSSIPYIFAVPSEYNGGASNSDSLFYTGAPIVYTHGPPAYDAAAGRAAFSSPTVAYQR